MDTGAYEYMYWCRPRAPYSNLKQAKTTPQGREGRVSKNTNRWVVLLSDFSQKLTAIVQESSCPLHGLQPLLSANFRFGWCFFPTVRLLRPAVHKSSHKIVSPCSSSFINTIVTEKMPSPCTKGPSKKTWNFWVGFLGPPAQYLVE